MGDTLIRDTEGNVRTIREMWETPPPKGTKLHSVTPEGQVVENDFIEAFPTGKRKVVRVKTRDGRVVECTPDHKFLTPDGTYKTIAEIGVGGQIVAAKLD
jgi:intein/homing endonuclease